MGAKTPIPEFLIATKAIRSETARMAASESVKFFKEGFVKQGFTDSSFEPWQKSGYPLAGKRTLYKSGKLMRSIKKQTETAERVVVVADSEYADIHNNGGSITVTEAMNAHFWELYYEEIGKGKQTKGKRLSKKAAFYKAMALIKPGSKIKISQRKFIGNSRALMNHLASQHKSLITKEMLNAFKKIKFK